MCKKTIEPKSKMKTMNISTVTKTYWLSTLIYKSTVCSLFVNLLPNIYLSNKVYIILFIYLSLLPYSCGEPPQPEESEVGKITYEHTITRWHLIGYKLIYLYINKYVFKIVLSMRIKILVVVDSM